MSFVRALLLLALAIAGWSATATDFTWNGSTDGDWATNANWTPNNGTASDPNGSNNVAGFSGPGANQPILANNRQVNQLNFAAGGGVTLTGASTLTLSGTTPTISVTSGTHSINCPIALAANTTIQVAAGCQLTIDSVISGAFTLTKTGTGTLILGGANTYTGTTTISAGTVRLTDGDALGGTTNGTTVASGAALVLTNGITLANEALTVNGTLGFDSAAACTIPVGSSVTIGGTVPTIEVLQGAHTVVCNVVVNADTTVFVATGATLTLSDTTITGTGLLTKVGGGTLTKESTAPSAPVITAPVAATTTNDTTPTWTWTGAGGTYRYTLDGGATGTTTSTSFTPGAALGNGVHTLVVAERDAAGNWSTDATRSVTVDGTPPYIVSRTTRDLNANGFIDEIEIVFSEAMPSAQVGTWTVGVYTPGAPSWSSATLLVIPLTELSTPDTGAQPSVRYTGATIVDAGGNALPTEGSGTIATDGAAPVLLSALGSGNSVTVTFSEPVVTTSNGNGNLQTADFAYTGGGTSLSGYSDANGLDQTATFTTSGAVASGSDTVGAAAAQIYDLSGTAMGTATVVVTAPATTKDTIAPGDWNNPATWQDGILPQYTDNVVIKHAVTIDQSGSNYVNFQVNSLTIDGGSLAATNDVSSGSYYTLISPQARLIEAKTSATITNVQFYDGYSGGSGVETVYKVSSGCTLTLTNTNQGFFTGTVVKQGSGELVWNSPPNQYGGYDFGATRVEAGTLRLVKAGARPNGYAINVFGGATLDLQQDISPSNLTGQGTIIRSTNGTTTLTLGGSSWSGKIQDGGSGKIIAVALNGANTWSGDNSFTGGLNLATGTLAVSGTLAIADTCPVALASGTSLTIDATETVGPLSGAGDIVLNTALTVAQSADATWSGAASGSGALRINAGSGRTLTLAGTNLHTGGTVLAGGTTVISGNAQLGAATAPLVFDGGTLRLADHVNMTANALAYSADGSGPTAAFPALAPFATQGASPADRPISITANDGGIDLNGFSLAAAGFNTAVGQDLTISGAAIGTGYNGADPALFLVVPNATTRTMAGALLAGVNRFGFLIKRGPGTLAITNPANTWDKNIVRAEAGILDFGASGSLGPVSASGWVYILPGATGSINNIVYASAPTLYLSGTLSVAGTSSWDGPVIMWSSTPVIGVSAGSQLSLSQVVSQGSATSLSKGGAGRLILGNTGNSISLPVSVAAGILQIAGDGSLGTSSLTLAGGTLFVPTGFTTTRALSLGAGDGNVDVDTSQALVWNGPVSGSGRLNKDGLGTLTLGNSGNSYQGDVRIRAGVLEIADDMVLGSASAPISDIMLDGGTLRCMAAMTISSVRGLSVSSNNGTVEIPTATDSVGFAGVVSGTGRLTKDGAGILALGGTNTNTGPIQVNAGTLSAQSAGALGTTAGVTQVANGAELELAGSFSSAEPLSLSGSGIASAGVLVSASGSQTLSGSIALVLSGTPVTCSVAGGGTLTMSGVVSGSGGLTKIGAGVLALGNTNTFSGQVTCSAGALAVDGDDRLGSGGNEVLLSGGALRATASFTTATRIVRISASGGTIDTQAFTLTLPGVDTGPAQALTLQGTGGTLVFDIPGGSTRNLSGAILAGSGVPALSLTGAGDLVVGSAANTWNGVTTVSAGRLQVTGALPGAVAVATGSTLAGNGSVGDLSVADGGILSPAGNNAGLFSAATLVLAPGAVLDFDLGTANDQIAVAGVVMIAAPVTTKRVLNIRGFPSNTVFDSNTADYTLITSGTGTLTYAATAVDFGTVPTSASSGIYSITADSSALILQRNRAPSVATGVADDSGTGSVSTSTTPPSYNIGPPTSVAYFSDDVAGTDVIPLVHASDPEGAGAASLTFTLKLDPSQGAIEKDIAGTWTTVSTGTAVATWTQADIDAGWVRYRSTGSVGGNDAILYDVQDAFGATSPLYLMRFTIQGNGPPVLGSLPATAVWQEEAVKPGAWGVLAPSATINDADTDPLDGGLLQISLINDESGDELGFNGSGVAVAGDGTVSVNGISVGHLDASSNSLVVTLNSSATLPRVQLLLQSASFRTSNTAPLAAGRSISISTKDGTLGGGTTIAAFPLEIDLYNDPPAIVATTIATVPGLVRSGSLTATDPEGLTLGSGITLSVVQSPIYGTLNFTPATGNYIYTTNFLPGSLSNTALEDTFTIRAIDVDFDDASRRTIGAVNDSRDAARYSDTVVHVNIGTDGQGLAFLNVPRMTVDSTTAGSFTYTPQLHLPSGAGSVVFELVDPPIGVTLGSGTGEINFNATTGAINWPAVPDPAGALPQYWRFGVLATDPGTGTATLLPIMLRVGPGGTNG
jgi:fibronectin-binding autotransporter adhesin